MADVDSVAVLNHMKQVFKADNRTAIRYLRWCDSLYAKGILVPPNYHFRRKNVARNIEMVIVTHAITDKEGKTTALGCAGCAKETGMPGEHLPTDSAWKLFAPPAQYIPMKLREAHINIAFLFCDACWPRLSKPGVFDLSATPAAADAETTETPKTPEESAG